MNLSPSSRPSAPPEIQPEVQNLFKAPNPARPSSLLRWLALWCLSFTFAAADDRIDMPVKINGQLMRFGFDTGCGAPVVLWKDVSQLLGLKITPQSDSPLAPGQVRFETSEPVDMEFAGQKFPAARITIVQAPDYARWEMQGLIGWPALSGNIMQLDLGRKLIRPLRSVPEETAGWLKFRVAEGHGTLALEIPQNDGTTGVLAIDTGDPAGISLAPHLWATWKNAHPENPVTLGAAEMLATGVSAMEIAVAREWSLGALTLTNVQIQEAHPSHVASGGDRYVATLGNSALRKLSLIVDARNGWAYLKSHDDSPGPGSYNRLGAVFLPASAKDSVTLVARVMPGGPAALAGLLDGDRLVKLNGLNPDHWRKRPGTWPLATFFEQPPGAQLGLAVQRCKETITIRPILQNILSLNNHPPHPTFDPAPALSFHFLPPQAELVRRATAADMHTSPFTLAREPGAMAKGDSVTALITCVDDEKTQQWLVLFAANDLKPAEKKAHRAPPTLFTSSGREIRFDATPAAIAIHVVGPVEENAKPAKVRDEWSGAIVTREFLSMGFDSTALTMRKLSALREGRLGFNSIPVAGKEAEANRAKLEAGGIHADDERAFVGGVMAIGEFFRIAAQTPGIRDVLRQMLDVSFKDLLKSPQINIHLETPVEIIEPTLWGLNAGAPCHAFRFRVDLNGVPRLLCRVATTPPARPLQTVAGVLGIVASRPDGSGPHVMVRVLSARPAEPASSNPP